MHEPWNPVTRRRFIAAASALGLTFAAGSALAQPGRAGSPKPQPGSQPEPAPEPVPQAAPEYFAWRALSDRVILAPGEGGNAILLLAPKSAKAALIDAKLPHFASTLRREAEARGGTVELLINTHHHADHIGGNLAFTQDRQVLAHEGTKARVSSQVERMKQMIKNGVRAIEDSESANAESARAEVEALAAQADTIDASKWMPTKTFSGRTGSATLAMTPIDLHQVGPGHTDNDVIVAVPQLDVVHMGDLVFNNLHPFIDRDGGASVRGWIKSLKYAKRLCKPATIVVPGHGEVTDVKGIDAMSDYLEKSLSFVEAQIRQKKTREEIIAMTVPGTEDRGFPHLRDKVLGAMYDEVKG